MKLSEDLLSSMVLELKGSYKIQYHAVSCCCLPRVAPQSVVNGLPVYPPQRIILVYEDVRVRTLVQ